MVTLHSFGPVSCSLSFSSFALARCPTPGHDARSTDDLEIVDPADQVRVAIERELVRVASLASVSVAH